MAEPVRARLFVEDAVHEALVRALVERLSRTLGIQVTIATATARGGQPRALTELRAFLRLLAEGVLAEPVPDVLVIVIDANCRGHMKRRREIEEITRDAPIPHVVIGCPEPHVERWLLLDAQALQRVLGVSDPTPPARCERGLYKRCFTDLVRRANVPTTQDPAQELAPEIVDAMRLSHIESDRSMRSFLRDVRAALRSAARA